MNVRDSSFVSAFARRGWSIGTDMLRMLVLRVSSDGEKREQASEDNPNVNAHQSSPAGRRLTAVGEILFPSPILGEHRSFARLIGTLSPIP
jgi:hypothetical protein